jgi:hypothetical protein
MRRGQRASAAHLAEGAVEAAAGAATNGHPVIMGLPMWPMQQLSARKVLIMRSEIVLAALHTKNRNRFELCHQIFKVVRKFHKPGNRVQDTATDALQRLADAEQQRGEAKSPNAIETKPEQIAIAS